MSISKYKKAILIFLPGILMGLILGISLANETISYTRLLPKNMGLQLSFIFWMSTIAAIIGGVIVGLFLAPLFLFVHKKVIGAKMVYGIQERPEPEGFKETFKGFFPSLMAINFALMFCVNPWVIELVYDPTYSSTPSAVEGIIPLLVFAVIVPLMMGIAMGAFSPVWLLLDSGIVYTNKNKVKDKRNPVEVRSVGGFYMYLLKGYAGIGVILSYYQFGVEMTSRFSAENYSFILIFLMPVVLTLMAIPAAILLDMTAKKRRAYILKFAKKFGITGPLADPFLSENKS